METEKAAFQLTDCKLESFHLTTSENRGKEVILYFEPKGLFDGKNKSFLLNLMLTGIIDGDEDSVFKIVMIGFFQLKDDVIELEDVPDYFYPNSIALVYPYLRALLSYVSTQSVQGSFLLPTLNLTGLGSQLKSNTVIQEV